MVPFRIWLKRDDGSEKLNNLMTGEGETFCGKLFNIQQWNLLININTWIIGIIDRIIMQYAWITNCNLLLHDIRVTFDIFVEILLVIFHKIFLLNW